MASTPRLPSTVAPAPRRRLGRRARRFQCPRTDPSRPESAEIEKTTAMIPERRVDGGTAGTRGAPNTPAWKVPMGQAEGKRVEAEAAHAEYDPPAGAP